MNKLPDKDLNSVARLHALRFFPDKKEAQTEILEAFATSCSSKDRVEQAVQYFLDNRDDCPTPHEIKSYCYQNSFHLEGSDRLKTLKEQQKTEPCADCAGNGRIIKEGWVKDPLKPGRPATEERPAEPQGRRWASWAEYCWCPYGQALKDIQKPLLAK